MRCAFPQQKRPCGQCTACKIAKREKWVCRGLLELRFGCREALFVTLTYAEENLPWATDPETGESRATLRKSDLQSFIHELRRTLKRKQASTIPSSTSTTSTPVRYIGRGEYGTKTERPHYHLILFGLGVDGGEMITRLWKAGFNSIRPADSTNIRYTVKYLMKDDFGKKSERLYGRQPSFNLYSSRPPVGYPAVPGLASALRGTVRIADYQPTKESVDLFQHGYFQYQVRIDGHVYPLDRTMVTRIKSYMRFDLGMSEKAVLFCLPKRFMRDQTDEETAQAQAEHRKARCRPSATEHAV